MSCASGKKEEGYSYSVEMSAWSSSSRKSARVVVRSSRKRASLDHLSIVAPLFDAYRVFYQQRSDVEAARDFLGALIRSNESVLFFAQNDQGDGIGFTQLYPMFSSVRMCRIWILNDLFVAPNARRQGVAEALMQAAAAFAHADGAADLALETAIDNHQAQALYKKLGYAQIDGFLHYTLDLNTERK